MSIDINNIQISTSRKEILKEEFAKQYFEDIKTFLQKEKSEWKIIFPKWSDIFNAFNLTPFEKVRVVILWQDPYHWTGEAHWLCFSVQDGIKQPPSLKNIFKEIKSDLWIEIPKTWNLSERAKQWVFLLNASLTVRKDEPNSHKDIWRQIFTDAVIKNLSDKKEWLIFVLRGSYAQSKEILIDGSRHTILKAAHPSPFSAYRWFWGCKHFSKINETLKNRWDVEIDWRLE